ncbi:MAG: hypothetical protein RL330_1086 [Actinomycetota bacterium]|jgi:hypothetical protein
MRSLHLHPGLRTIVATTLVAASAVSFGSGSASAGGVLLSCEPAITDLGEDTIAVFTETTTCSWRLPDDAESVSFLLVGGGGSGGLSSENSVGGGGGGGVVHGTNQSFAQDLVITIGEGGAITEACAPFAAADGGFSSIYVASDTPTTLTAFGGGHGAGCGENGQATEGGSGGGGHGAWVSLGGGGTGGDIDGPASGSISFLGSSGGGGHSGGDVEAGGGGGGATEVGESGSVNGGGDGGEGFTSDITGTAIVYGSGGGGSSTVGPGAGGTNAGNAFGLSPNVDLLSPYNGVDGTGGGGGGVANDTPGRGGSGILVLRWSGPELPGTGTASTLVGTVAALMVLAGLAVTIARRPRRAMR